MRAVLCDCEDALDAFEDFLLCVGLEFCKLGADFADDFCVILVVAHA